MSNRSIFRQMLIGSYCAARASMYGRTYERQTPDVHGRSCALMSTRAAQQGFKLARIGNGKPLRSNSIDLHVARRQT